MIKFKDLPVYKSKQLILDALEKNQVIIVESPTGSGKTTQIPIILNEAGYTNTGIVGITQPRRIATLNVCSFINRQIEDQNYPENFCAYKMRFYDTTDINTKIKILTDGMLLQELKLDSTLSKYSVLMVDEAHERSLNIDFILGLLKEIISKRSDFKVIISSATINTETFSKFFNNAPIISIQTKTYNVDIKYYPITTYTNNSDSLPLAICQIINILLKEFKKTDYKENKDTLVFLPGEFEIKTTMAFLYSECDHSHLQIYPLYGRLNKEEQELVFEETQPQKMKVVLATNIAETSLTINGIEAVIDSGLSKMNFYNQYDFTSSLTTHPISKASAMQRTGRAGRTSDGVCYRLYSEEDFNKREAYTSEEILRTDLSEVVLRMVDLGIKKFEKFNFIRKPNKKSLESGELTLLQLNAIDKERNLTEIGKLMVKFPLLPRHARCIVSAIQNDIDFIKPICVCVSFLSCKTPFLFPAGEEDSARNAHKRFYNQFGDFIGYQFLYRDYTLLSEKAEKEKFCTVNYLDYQSMEEIEHVTNQLCEIVREMGIPVIEVEPNNTEEFAKRSLQPIICGLIQYVCVRKKASVYSTLNTDEILIHPGSAYFKNPPQYLVAGEIVLTTKMYARTVSPLKKEWIEDVAPSLVNTFAKLTKSFDKKASKTEQLSKKISDKEKIVKNSNKFYNLLGTSLPVIYDNSSKSTEKIGIAIIKPEQVRPLLKKYRNASRHPKNFKATILFKGYYLNYGDKLYDVLSCGKCYDFIDSDFVQKIPKTIYSHENFEDLKKNLSTIMKISPMEKNKNMVGYVELISSHNSFFLHVNKNFNDALGNSAYSLISLADMTQDKAFTKTYERIIKFID